MSRNDFDRRADETRRNHELRRDDNKRQEQKRRDDSRRREKKRLVDRKRDDRAGHEKFDSNRKLSDPYPAIVLFAIVLVVVFGYGYMHFFR